jgi:hypothetical protein
MLIDGGEKLHPGFGNGTTFPGTEFGKQLPLDFIFLLDAFV